MKTSYLLSSVAVALLVTAGAASAQMKEQLPPDRAPAAQQAAPPAKIAPSIHSGRHETTGQAPRETQTGPSGVKPDSHASEGAAATGQVEHKNLSDTQGSASVKENNDSKATTGSSAKAGSSATANEHSTTGQGAATGHANLSTEQRAKITTILKEKKVQPVHLNVSVKVGARVPASVHFYPVPTEVVTIYPQWRGYDYILVGDQVLIIDPGTHEIVAVLEA
jgi:hypothetical protein